MSSLSYSLLNFIGSFVKKSFFASIIFILGYFKCSPAWVLMPILLSVWSEKRKRNREKKLTYGLLKCDPELEKLLINLLKSDDLPSWVNFPDFERAEWLNRIIKQLWPSVNIYAEDILRETVEPMLKDVMTNLKLGTFKFEKPVRVGGIKVYETNISRKEIIMDLEVIYHGDCKISVSINKIKAGIKDLCVQGMLRVVMKPLIPKIPLVGGIQAYFLKTPSIDYLLTNAAEIVDIPGLGDVIRKLVISSVASICVLPNKYCITLAEGISMYQLKKINPMGVLRIHLIQAKDLPRKDVGFHAKSDPYCVINLGAQEYQTQVIEKTLNPMWNYMCEVVCEDFQQSVNLRVIDEDKSKPFNEDDFIGSCSIDISPLAGKGYSDLWLSVQDMGKINGKVNVVFQWLNVSSDPTVLKKAAEYNSKYSNQIKGPGFSLAVLSVFIDSANNLSTVGSRHEEPDSKVILTCAGARKETLIKYRTCDPIWEESFVFFIKDVEHEDVSFMLIDERTGTKLGEIVYAVKTLLKESELELEMSPILLLGSRKSSRLVLSMRLMILVPGTLTEKQILELHMNSEADIMDSSMQESSALTIDSKNLDSSVNPYDSDTYNRFVAGNSIPETKISNENIKDHLNNEKLLGSIDSSLLISNSVSESEIVKKEENLEIESALRKRNVFDAYGKIKLTLRYSNARGVLIVVVHEAKNLPLEDENELPDPYIKLYLLPDKKESSKRKTRSYKDECNPVYDETFEFDVMEEDLKNRHLEVSACSKKKAIKFMSKTPVLGMAFISLEYMDLSQAVTKWFSFSSPDTLLEHI